jgi:hypothetical protein
MNHGAMTEHPEEKDSLWHLVVSPTIWAVHFLASYITAAIWCAKLAGRDSALNGVRTAIGVYTLLALVGIGMSGWRGWRAIRRGSRSDPPGSDTPAERHHFLGFANLLLSLLSAVATLFVALVAVFFEDCS